MLEPLFEDLIRRDAARHIKKAIVTIDGEDYEYPITKTVIRDGFFKHYIEVEDDPIGTVEKAVAVDEFGRALITQNPNFLKGDEGWQMAFKVSVKIQEEGDGNEPENIKE